MTRAETIPLSRIAGIQIYHAKRFRERDMAKVLSETGGGFCFNGTIFSWKNYKPLCHCRAGGTDLCKPDYSVYGVAFRYAPRVAACGCFGSETVCVNVRVFADRPKNLLSASSRILYHPQ